MKRILGLEGGGTKSEWLLAADSLALDGGVLPPANLRLISDEALERLLRGLPGNPTHVGVFLAGCVNEADRTRLGALAARVWPEASVAVGSDRESGFAAAFRGGDGVAVIAGTGSAITGRKDGRCEKAGGWGQLLGDTGSGYDLAVQALRHVLWNYDLKHTVDGAAQAILDVLALRRLEDLVNWARDADKMSVAKLAPVVFAAAAQGDAAMAAILDRGARALADGAVAVARRLGLERPRIELQGGLFVHQSEYVERFKRRLEAELPEAAVGVCLESGAAGAAWLTAQTPGEGTAPIACPASPEAAPPAPESELQVAELAEASTEAPNPRSAGLDAMSTSRIVELFVDEEVYVGRALAGARRALVAAVESIVEVLQSGGRLFYVGAGTSGRLGVLDASEIPPTFGADPETVQAIVAGGVAAVSRAVEGAEDRAEDGALAMMERGVRRGDAVCGITASGRTPFVLGALRQARTLGARTVLMACNPARQRSGAPWEIEIDLDTGPELLAGSTRLKAGTATKCALNILSTVAMIRLGKTEGNLMAGVVVSNAKLRDRAIRLVSALRGVPRTEARMLLEQNGWKVRTCLKD